MKKKEINYQLLIRRICLIVLDIICIIAASILALLTRFEFDFSQIPKEFLKVIYKYGPFTIVITLIIFSLFRIPFKGGLYGGDQGWFPPYVHGLYRTGRIRLFVTSGLSSEKQKLPRWNNRPEIAVLNVH